MILKIIPVYLSQIIKEYIGTNKLNMSTLHGLSVQSFSLVVSDNFIIFILKCSDLVMQVSLIIYCLIYVIS